MRKFGTSLREHAANIINFEKTKYDRQQKRAKITSECDSLLHLWKKILKKVF